MFKLSENFIEQYRDKQPKWSDFAYFIYKRTYSRALPDGKFEEFWQTLQRVVEGVYQVQKEHCEKLKLPWNPQKSQKSAQRMYELMWNFKFLPAGRSLWMMGTDYIKERGSSALFNCAFVSTDELDVDFAFPFLFLMDFSMLGVGVGSDMQGVGKVRIRHPKYTTNTLVVDDSREGWIQLIEVILNSFVGKALYPKNIDYSKIRPAGAILKSFGGISAGSKPLEDLVANITNILVPSEESESYPITCDKIVDVFNYIGKCVVSGNIRRTAENMLGNYDDEVFASLKLDGKACADRRWASNNSVICKIGIDYTKLAERTAQNGEPGYFWIDNARKYGRMIDPANNIDQNVKGLNPCGEITLESGETCNLVETFPSNHDNYEEYQETLKYAYLYAKSITLIPTHNSRTNAVVMRNRRIGASQSGIVASFAKHGRRTHFDWCNKGYNYLKELDKKYSDWLCIPRSIKITTVKPSGTVSILAGVTPGIHYPHSEYYIRNVRVSMNSPLVNICKKAGYIVEKDKCSDNTMVISFPIHEKDFERSKYEVSMFEQLENVAQMQAYWADNSVSATITFNSAEKENIKRALEMYETRLKSISFLPLDHEYEQAPYVKIDKEKYDELVKNIKPLKLRNLNLFEVEDKFCDGDKCYVQQKEN